MKTNIAANLVGNTRLIAATTIHQNNTNPKDLKTLASLLILVVALCCAPQSHADVAFSSLDSNGSYSTTDGEQITGANFSDSSIANSFVPTLTGNLNSIDLGIGIDQSVYEGGDGNFVLTLVGNNPIGGPLMTQVLASGNLTSTAIFGATDVALTTFTYTGSAFTLSLGTTYWLVLKAGDADTGMIWSASTTSVTSDEYYSTDGGATYVVQPGGEPSGNRPLAFSVNASPVPEPSTWAMIAVAGLGMIGFTRKHRKITSV